MPGLRILDRLAGESPPPARARDELASIAESLQNLLSSRRGAPATPGLGLPDFSELAFSFPGALAQLKRHVREQIRRYEPRLRDVEVRELEPDGPMMVRLQISGRLVSQRGEAVHFNTRLQPSAPVTVEGR